MAKHYITIDNKKRVTKGFSDDFEQPLDTDICIADNVGRQFELLGQINPPIINQNGIYLYKYENDQVLNRTQDEINMDLVSLPKPEPTPAEKLNARMNAIEDALLFMSGI